MTNRIFWMASLVVLAGASANANIIFNGATATTVYGATNYVCCDAGAPTYIPNNITGLNDILSSPGNGFQIANPIIQNNVAQGPLNALTPYTFGAIGGININGFAFGSGVTTVWGPNISTGLSDTNAGCCTASYEITSEIADFSTDGAAFIGSLGDILSMGGINLTGADSSVMSLVTEFQIGNGPLVSLPDLVLAITGNCVNQVLIGTSVAAANAGCTNGGNGGAFSALAIGSTPGAVVIAPNTSLKVISTLTAYSDPSSIDSIQPDLSLLPGTTLPDALVSDTDPTPEPASMALIGAGLVGVAMLRRRRKTA